MYILQHAIVIMLNLYLITSNIEIGTKQFHIGNKMENTKLETILKASCLFDFH